MFIRAGGTYVYVNFNCIPTHVTVGQRPAKTPNVTMSPVVPWGWETRRISGNCSPQLKFTSRHRSITIQLPLYIPLGWLENWEVVGKRQLWPYAAASYQQLICLMSACDCFAHAPQLDPIFVDPILSAVACVRYEWAISSLMASELA